MEHYTTDEEEVEQSAKFEESYTSYAGKNREKISFLTSSTPLPKTKRYQRKRVNLNESSSDDDNDLISPISK